MIRQGRDDIVYWCVVLNCADLSEGRERELTRNGIENPSSFAIQPSERRNSSLPWLKMIRKQCDVGAMLQKDTQVKREYLKGFAGRRIGFIGHSRRILGIDEG